MSNTKTKSATDDAMIVLRSLGGQTHGISQASEIAPVLLELLESEIGEAAALSASVDEARDSLQIACVDAGVPFDALDKPDAVVKHGSSALPLVDRRIALNSLIRQRDAALATLLRAFEVALNDPLVLAELSTACGRVVADVERIEQLTADVQRLSGILDATFSASRELKAAVKASGAGASFVNGNFTLSNSAARFARIASTLAEHADA